MTPPDQHLEQDRPASALFERSLVGARQEAGMLLVRLEHLYEDAHGRNDSRSGWLFHARDVVQQAIHRLDNALEGKP